MGEVFMRKGFIGMAVVVMACVVAAQATVIPIQDTTTSGNGTTVRDGSLLALSANYNNGISTQDRQYSDAVSSGDKRHSMYWFDLSSLKPAWTINSATFGVYMTGAGALVDLKLSRFKPGKDWIEGTKDFATALTGEPTWNSQKHSSNPAWQVAGATGVNDVDQGATQQTFTGAAGYNIRDVKTWVQAWVSGTYANNGMLLWGGTGTATSCYKVVYFSEDSLASNRRPYLTVDYTVPEPVTGLLLAVGLVPMLRRRRSA